MVRRTALFLILLVSVPLILSACGGDDLSTDDAEKALRAGFSGDVDEANKYFCDDNKLTEEEASIMEGIEVKSVSCEKDGDNMKCDYTISLTVEGSEPQEFSSSATIAVKDGKLCGDVSAAPQ
jgi:hypothetical protein